MKRRREQEISWTFAPRIAAGRYPAYCVSARTYRDPGFKRWVCKVQFDVLDQSLVEKLARLTWYINLGNSAKPHAGRRGKYWRAWREANGGPPKRNDRVTERVFVGRYAIVSVEDTNKTFCTDVANDDEKYSVVRDVIEWQTGGPR